MPRKKKQKKNGLDAVDIAILSVLLGISKTYGKNYVYPSQETILELLWRFHKVGITRRTLNRKLKWLEGEMFLKRTCRHTWKRGQKRKNWVPRTTMYQFCPRLFSSFFSLGRWFSGVVIRSRVTKKSQVLPLKGKESRR